MKKTFFAMVLTGVVLLANAAGIEGKWQTIDDASGKPKAIITMVKTGNTYTGKITDLAAGVENNCTVCKNPKTQLIGTTIVMGLKEAGENKYENGQIFDPKSGKMYQSKATLTNGGHTLEVRGYVGISMFGRTQKWKRVN